MNPLKTFGYDGYQLDLLSKILGAWGALMVVLFVLNCFWFFANFTGTLIQNLVAFGVGVVAFVLRRIANKDNRVQVAHGFTVLTAIILSSTAALVGEPYVLIVPAGLVVHVVTSSLIMPPRGTVWLGIGTAGLYLAAIAVRIFLLAPEEAWSVSRILASTAFPTACIITASVFIRSQIDALRQALSQVTALEGLLPICSYCNKIKDADENWHSVESYLRNTTDVQLSHGICPDCYEGVVAELDSPLYRRASDRWRVGDDASPPSSPR
jgi:hypothetical protein